jgi:anhydro-N-acetylmuramic acid kinase
MSDAPLYVGVISGTSVDGLDIALLADERRPRIIRGETIALPNTLRVALLELGQPGLDDLDRLGHADALLGDFIGRSVLAFLNRLALTPDAIAAIGSHGQTVRHRPTHIPPFTLQIGDPNRIAELTGITTVADFRRRDVAAGGQGAPLVPPFHRALFAGAGGEHVVLNIGGISNITILSDDAQAPTRGFDTGPGNGLMDAWTQKHLGIPFDTNGAWASTGQCNSALLAHCLEDPYFGLPPPKSTGREYFNLAWLDACCQRSGLGGADQPEDVQATLLALTASSVANAIARWAPEARAVTVCGGGRRNSSLMLALSERIASPVQTSESSGVDGDSLEAAAFAWLAARCLRGDPANEPAVTGALGPRVLGAIHPGR